MHELKFLKYAAGTINEGIVAYTRIENFVVYTGIDRPCFNPTLCFFEDIQARIELEEWVELFGKPSLVFYDLQTYRAYPYLNPGQYELDRIALNENDLEERMAIFPRYCPPKLVELFSEFIGGFCSQQLAASYGTFDDFEEKCQTRPKETIKWLTKHLSDLGVVVGRGANNEIIVGKLDDKSRWVELIKVNVAPKPGDEANIGRLRDKAEYHLRVAEEISRDHQSFCRQLYHQNVRAFAMTGMRPYISTDVFVEINALLNLLRFSDFIHHPPPKGWGKREHFLTHFFDGKKVLKVKLFTNMDRFGFKKNAYRKGIRMVLLGPGLLWKLKHTRRPDKNLTGQIGDDDVPRKRFNQRVQTRADLLVALGNTYLPCPLHPDEVEPRIKRGRLQWKCKVEWCNFHHLIPRELTLALKKETPDDFWQGRKI